jgi:hypothetical protein
MIKWTDIGSEKIILKKEMTYRMNPFLLQLLQLFYLQITH